MSAVNALDRLQSYAKFHPSQELERSVSVLRAGPVSACAFDYDQAIAILRHCPTFAGIDDGPREARLRKIVSALVLHVRPAWRWLIPLGRGYLASHLTPDAKQVFDAAGLYGPSNDHAVRAWWDELAQTLRDASAESRIRLGRRGEDLTVEHEKRLLVNAGRSDLRPEAVGFEDNTLGYDVRSFVVAGTSVRSKYVEVKATESRPLRFHFSRNEWRAAKRYGDDYVIHLWHLPTEDLFEINFGQLSSHVPLDQGFGEWETAIVAWDDSPVSSIGCT